MVRGTNKRDLRLLLSSETIDVRRAVEESGLNCVDLLELGELELSGRLKLGLEDIRKLEAHTAQAVRPRLESALRVLDASSQLHQHPQQQVQPSSTPCCASLIPTGFAPLDHHLGGGLLAGAVTELVGPAGVGKTQLCLATCAHALLAGRRVVYMDTERSFSATRLMQLLQELGAMRSPPTPQATLDLLLEDRLALLSPTTWAEYASCMASSLEEQMLRRPVATLLVVDSIAAAIQWEYDTEARKHVRQQAANTDAGRLKYLASTYGACVLAVNQVRTGAGGPGIVDTAEGDVGGVQGNHDSLLVASLGTMWAHAVNMRLVLQHPAMGEAEAEPLPPPP